MKNVMNNKVVLSVLSLVLIVAMALLTIGCGQKANSDSSEANAAVTKIFEDGATIGEGEKEFTFIVVDGNGNEKKFTVNTDSDTVGAALLENGIMTRKYFYPITSDFDVYRNRFAPEATPIAFSKSKSVLTLPLYPELSDATIEEICDIIRNKS